jgi:hypothetical protein
MVGRILKPAAIVLFVFTLACCTLLAQSPAIAHTSHSIIVTPAQAPAGLKSIYSNLGPTATDDYNDTTGYYVAGATQTTTSEQWIALPFTNKLASHVEEIEAAIGYISGTNLVDVGIYSDSGSNSVGTLIASGSSKTVPTFGTCCTLVTIKFKPPGVSLTAATQYWIVGSTDDTNGPDFLGAWAASNDDNVGGDVASGGWFTFSANVPAAAVLGTIP